MEPLQGHNVVQSSNTELPSPTRVVRVNWLKFLFYSWKRISTLSKFVVTSSVLLVLAQVATAIAILITSRHESCDEPLRIFIIVYAIRILISCPFYVGDHFRKAEQRLQYKRRMQRDRRREEQVRLRRLQRREARQRARETGVTEPEPVVSSNASIASTIVQPRSTFLTSWGERLKSLIDLFAVLWFIVGNYLLFTSNTCSTDAPRLFYTSLTFILVGYFMLIVPLVLCTSVILCLPCVLVIMRELNMTELNEDGQGERAEEISKIPVYRFKLSQAGEQPQGVTTQSSPKSKGFLSKLLHKYQNGDVHDDIENGSHEDMYISPAEDALCCICLSDYENSDLLCRLWCGHHFHRSCLKEWLSLNRKCPLCKQDFRGKEYDEDSEDEDADDDIVGESSRQGEVIQLNQLNR